MRGRKYAVSMSCPYLEHLVVSPVQSYCCAPNILNMYRMKNKSRNVVVILSQGKCAHTSLQIIYPICCNWSFEFGCNSLEDFRVANKLGADHEMNIRLRKILFVSPIASSIRGVCCTFRGSDADASVSSSTTICTDIVVAKI